MASLGLTWCLDAVTSTSNLELNEGSSDLEVVISNRKRSVFVYNVEKREPIKSWSCRPNEELTCGTIYDPLLKSYATIVNSKAIRLWTNETESLDSCQKIYFASELQTLLSFPRKGSVLVFSNGFVEPLSKALEHPKETRAGIITDRICLCDLSYDETGFLVGLLTVNEATGVHSIRYVGQGADGSEVRDAREISAEFKTVEAVAFLKDEGLSLIMLWSDRSVAMFKPRSHKTENVIDQWAIKLPAWEDDEHVSLVDLGKKHIGIARTSSRGTNISVWDSQYEVEKASKTVPLECQRQVWKGASCLFLISGDQLHVMPYELEATLLSSVIGLDSFAMDGKEERSKTSIVKANWLCTEPNPAMSLPNNVLATLPETLQESVRNMLDRGQTASVICRCVLSQLLETENTTALACALEAFVEIPEDVLFKLLQYFLRPDLKETRVRGKGVEEEPVDPTKRGSYLNLVLKKPFNDVLIFQHLQCLSLENLKALLLYLRKCLDSLPQIQRGPNLTSMKIMEWLCVILDAQFYNITLTRDDEIKPLVDQLVASVKSQFTVIEELEQMELMVNKLLLKTSPEPRFPPYSIEILRIL